MRYWPTLRILKELYPILNIKEVSLMQEKNNQSCYCSLAEGFDLYLKKKKKKQCDLKHKDNHTGKVTISSSIPAVEELRGAKW